MTRRLHDLIVLVAAATALALAWLGASAPAWAAWPDKPVKIIVPWSAGAITDALGRLLAQEYSKVLGQQFVVENRPGAAGNIGAEAVANATPDGYTLLPARLSNLVIGPVTRTDVRYDPLRDFVAIGRVAHVPYGLAVNASVPARSLRELADLARANPGKLTYATLGAGTTNDYGMALFRKAANVDMLGVDYKGASSMTIDVVAGRVDAYFNEIAAVWQHVQSGALRILAIASPKRISRAPDIPTTAEQGFPSVVVAPWYGLLAPAGTPPEIVRRLESAYAAAMRSPTTRRRIEALGYEPIDDAPGQFAAALRDDIRTFRALAGPKPAPR